jgi:hypothetical protein
MVQRAEDYALLGDLHTAAPAAGRDVSIDWLCPPRFDSPAIFAARLGDEDSGFWRLAPVGRGPPACTRRDSLVLETEWDTGRGDRTGPGHGATARLSSRRRAGRGRTTRTGVDADGPAAAVRLRTLGQGSPDWSDE